MTAPAVSQPRTSTPKDKSYNYNSVTATAVLTLLAAIGTWPANSAGINLVTISESADSAVNFVVCIFPLEFPSMVEPLSLIGEALATAFLATVLSVILPVPLIVFIAHITTFPPTARWISHTFVVFACVAPDLVLTTVLIHMFGIGAIDDILVMSAYSVGIVAKLYADAVEKLDDGPREAIGSAGGSRTQ